MTREEEIKQYCADNGFPYGACSSLSNVKAQIATEAIKWADKTMLDKVCEHLYEINRNNLAEYGRRCPMINVVEFRKAMEE